MTLFVPLLRAVLVASGVLRGVERGTYVVSSILMAGVVAWVMLFAQAELPTVAIGLPQQLEPTDPGQSSRVLDRNGRVLARLDEGFDRRVVGYGDIPVVVRDAVVAIEDDSFWEHDGIDLSAIARAAIANIAEGAVQQGGSTITMQYVRNAFAEVGRDDSVGRKLREVVAALRIEGELPKEEILAAYLNRIYFGRGAYGIEAAARAYFRRPVGRLELKHAATLAGLIHAPSAYRGKPDRLLTRRNRVLERMAANGMITPERARRVKGQPLGIAPVRVARARAPYFVEYIKAVLRAPVSAGGYGMTGQQIHRGGYTIRTTLDLRMQRAAERAVEEMTGPGDPEVAMVAMTTRGEVRAMIGGRSQHPKRARGFNYAAQRAPGGGRSPGSTFKTFALASYIDQGLDLDERYPAPATDYIDACGDGSEPWKVSNYDHRSYGSLDPVRATEDSVNTAYANMIVDIGPSEAAAMAERLGITSPLAAVCSIALGSSGVTPLEMAHAYSTLAARGVRSDVVAISSIEDADGTVIVRADPERFRVLNQDVADTVNQILERVMTYGTGAPARIDRPAAGKTGTSESKRDLWFVGFTPHPGLTAAVWVGHRDGSGREPRSVQDAPGRPATGGGFAGGIWREFMERATDGMRVREFPEPDAMPRSEPPRETGDVTIEREGSDSVVVRGARERPAKPEPTRKPAPKPEPSPAPSPEPSREPSPEPTGEAGSAGSP